MSLSMCKLNFVHVVTRQFVRSSVILRSSFSLRQRSTYFGIVKSDMIMPLSGGFPPLQRLIHKIIS